MRIYSDPRLTDFIWKPIPGFPGYFACVEGFVKSDFTYSDGRHKGPRILRQNKAGSLILRRDNKNFSVKIARMILSAWVRLPSGPEEKARHLDDDTRHNHLANLAWGTPKDNYDDAVKNGSHGPRTKGAILRGNALRGKERSTEVRLRISQTKRENPERQHYGKHQDSLGRFIRGNK